jgi:hypothetical protein
MNRRRILVPVLVALACSGAEGPKEVAKKPTLAVLPFVGGSSAEKALAERMRFAVSQKLSTDANAVTEGGPYDRLDNVQVDNVVSALQLSFASPDKLPDEGELQQLLASLGTDYTIAGSVKGRQLSLTLYQGTAVAKRATADIPPGTDSPKLAVEKVLTELTGTAFAHIREVEADHSNPAVERRFAERPNLVPDPAFELAAKDPKKAATKWQAILGPDAYPPPLLTLEQARVLGPDRVAVVPRAATGLAEDGKGGGNVLLLRMSKKVAENNGLACETTWIPMKHGKKYRFTVRYHSTGPTLHLFLKGFGEKADQYSSASNPESMRREFYRAQVVPREKNAGWELIEMDFTPSTVKASDPKIQWMRLDLYVYLHPGDVFFDDVTLKEIEE